MHGLSTIAAESAHPANIWTKIAGKINIGLADVKFYFMLFQCLPHAWGRGRAAHAPGLPLAPPLCTLNFTQSAIVH